MTTLAPVLQAFFTERLMAQRRASSHTITGYRDTLRLLVGFASAKTGKTPSALDIADLDAPLVAAFLDHLEADPPSTRCSATPHCTTPDAPPLSSGSWPSRPSATSAHCPPGSPRQRSAPCWPHPTGARGPAGVITPCSCSPSRPGCGSPS
jgi:hypothetical protein